MDDYFYGLDVCLFAQTLSLSKDMVAKRASAGAQQSCVADQEQTNAELMAELEQSLRIKMVEMEGRQDSLRSRYQQLSNECKELQSVAETLQ
jgi:hypothetical protein